MTLPSARITGPLRWLVRRSAVVALALGILTPLLGPAGVAPVPTASAASGDLTIVTSAAYLVQPKRALVHVTLDLTAVNHLADTRTNRFFFDHAFLAVQPGVTGLRVVSGPKSAHVSAVKRAGDATLLRVDFGGKLYGGKSTALRLAFDLKDTGTGARRLVRVGTSLITFPVWAFASDGASGSRVTVRFPAGYDVQVDSGSFATSATASDGGKVLATGALANPLKFFAYVSAQQPATYRSSSLGVPVAGGTIPLTMRAWKDDPTWASRVGSLFKRALPVLQGQIGLAWPHLGPVVVQEAVSRSTGGYAGLYDPKAGLIQVAYWASQAVTVHEAAHGWFNGSLLADRWAVEGFASLYGQRALTALGIKAPAPSLTAQLKATAFPLNAWPATPAPAAASETYGYAASYTLAAAIAKRAGDAALARVWADAAGHIAAYQPPAGQGTAAPETAGGPPDWRGLLDLLDTASPAGFTDLWRAWVVRPEEAGLLDARTAARAQYAGTLAQTSGWSLPRSIRDAMRAWQFDVATASLASARPVLAERPGLEQAAAQAGVTLPGTVQALFEAGSFNAALDEARHERDAIAAIALAAAARAAGTDTLTAIGMIGSDPDRDITAARAALAAGDPGAAVVAADAAVQARSDAWREGRRRALMVVAAVAALIVLGLVIGTRSRRRRRGSSTAVVA